jgi:hypothetical protein
MRNPKRGTPEYNRLVLKLSQQLRTWEIDKPGFCKVADRYCRLRGWIK